MTDNSKLLDKIQKLLNLSTSSNANEAAAALAKASEIMAEHNLTQSSLLRHQIGQIDVKSSQSISKAKDWETMLFVTIGKAFGCKVMFTPGQSWNKKDYWARFNFVGPKMNLPLVEYTATFLQRQLVKERAAFSVTLSNHGYSRGREMSAELDGFCKGWLRTITPKVHAFALDIDLQKAIDDFVKEATEGRKAKSHDRGHGTIGDFHGTVAAKNVDINRPMNATETRRLA